MKRLYRLKILSQDYSTAEKGEVWIDDEGRIALCGTPTSPAPAFDEEIDCAGGLVLPGLKNAHTHSAMTFLRSRADDLPLDRWLSEAILPRERYLTDEAVYWLTKLAILEYVSGGTTAAFDMYFHTDAYVDACRSAGFRSVLTGSAVSAEKTPLKTAYDLYKDYNHEGDRLITGFFGLHSEYATTPELVKEFAEVARAEKIPVYMHLSETKKEQEECIARHGKTPTEYFLDLGLWDYGGGGYHCTHLTDGDIRLFREHSLYAVTCPAANLKLASGIAPLYEMLEAGVKVAIGTDGPAGNNALDMFREMYLASTLQKARTGKAEAVQPDAILRAATSTGADAMGLPDCNSLAVGKWADLTVLDLDMPNLRPHADYAKAAVYSAGKQNVKLTMVAGKTLYRDGNYYIGEDAETICKNAEKQADLLEQAFLEGKL